MPILDVGYDSFAPPKGYPPRYQNKVYRISRFGSTWIGFEWFSSDSNWDAFLPSLTQDVDSDHGLRYFGFAQLVDLTLPERANHSIAVSQDISKPTRRACGESGRAGLVGKILADIGSSSSLARSKFKTRLVFGSVGNYPWCGIISIWCVCLLAQRQRSDLYSPNRWFICIGEHHLKQIYCISEDCFLMTHAETSNGCRNDSEAIQVFGGPTQSPC